jgi:uncharacterized iron-regulated protein
VNVRAALAIALVFAPHISIAQSQPPAPAAAAPAVYVPQRVYDTSGQRFSDFETMLADLAKADVVFVGEQHDDPATHRLEAAILDGLRRRGVPVVLSLEMFERDVQPAVSAYLAGKTTEEEFLKISRPWPRYATDYRALVEMAKAERWPVIASNVPRRYASDVAKTGRAALDALPAADRALAAQDLVCPKDAYFERFADNMARHPMPGSEKLSAEDKRAQTDRYYDAQCLKDETMAEAIARGIPESGRGTVVHVNGAFHSDFGYGTAERLRRRLDGRRIAVVSILPIAAREIDTVSPSAEDLRRGDYLLYALK